MIGNPLGQKVIVVTNENTSSHGMIFSDLIANDNGTRICNVRARSVGAISISKKIKLTFCLVDEFGLIEANTDSASIAGFNAWASVRVMEAAAGIGLRSPSRFSRSFILLSLHNGSSAAPRNRSLDDSHSPFFTIAYPACSIMLERYLLCEVNRLPICIDVIETIEYMINPILADLKFRR